MKKMTQLLNNKVTFYFIFIAIIIVPLFGFLNTQPVRVWDEARNAVNAYEMYKNGFSLIPTYDGNPDM